MKARALLVALSLTCATSSFAASIVYDFQAIPAGSLPGGFLNLTVDGVTASINSFELDVDINPVTGTHFLHTYNYQSGMGIELSMPISQIIVGIESTIPTQHNYVQAISYYGPGYTLYPMPRPPISSFGAPLVFNVPQQGFPAVYGIGLDGTAGNGYAVDYISIQLVPEPTALSLFVLGTATAVALRVGRRAVKRAGKKASLAAE